MLIDNNGRYSIFSLYPNSDWTDGSDTKYVVDDNSELANKIMEYGECEFVEDENGNLVDVTKKPLPIEVVRAKKIEEMSQKCHETIVLGVDFNGEHYSLDSDAQTNITNLFMLSQNPATANNLAYHSDGNVCRKYSALEIQGLYSAMFSAVAYNTTYFNLLKDDVSKMTTNGEISAVVYGYPLSAGNQAIMAEILGVVDNAE